MKYGFEREAFLLNKEGEVQIVPKELSRFADGSGLQLEARGEPNDNILQAWYSMLANHEEMKRAVKALNPTYTISLRPIMKVHRDIKRKARRVYEKTILAYQNLYGHKDHKHTQSECTAGIHISFTNRVQHWSGDNNLWNNDMWDYAQMFIHLDKWFSYSFKNSKRRGGFYELKRDGRIEYRSLPNTIDIEEIEKAINSFYKSN